MAAWLNRVSRPFRVRLIDHAGVFRVRRLNTYDDVIRNVEEARKDGLRIYADKRDVGYRKVRLFDKDFRGL